MLVTRKMIAAAHDVTLKGGDVILSADLITRIYMAMRRLEQSEDSEEKTTKPLVAIGEAMG